MLKAFWTKKKPTRSIPDNPAKPTRIVFLRPQRVPNSPEGNAKRMKDKVIEPVNIEAVPALIPRENTAMDESPVSNALKAINHSRILIRDIESASIRILNDLLKILNTLTFSVVTGLICLGSLISSKTTSIAAKVVMLPPIKGADLP